MLVCKFLADCTTHSMIGNIQNWWYWGYVTCLSVLPSVCDTVHCG